MRTNQAAPEHCWEPADNPSSAWGCRAESAHSSPLPPFLPLIEISTQYYFNPHPLTPPPPPALPCRLSPPMQALSMRTSCLPKLLPLGAGPRQGQVGTVWVVPAWLSPSLQNAFPAGSVLSEWCLCSWDLGLALEPSHLGA